LFYQGISGKKEKFLKTLEEKDRYNKEYKNIFSTTQ